MQTFLPYTDFRLCAVALDNRRLGKQRVEAYQILKIITGKSINSGWRNHPAVLMWDGYAPALYFYMREMCWEWVNRNYVDNLVRRCEVEFTDVPLVVGSKHMPHWLGETRLHSSHRAALLYKNYDHYKVNLWTETPDLNYWWPVTKS